MLKTVKTFVTFCSLVLLICCACSAKSVHAGSDVRTDISPADETGIAEMNFAFPEGFDFVRRDITVKDGVITKKLLLFTKEDKSATMYVSGAFGTTAEEAFVDLRYALREREEDISEQEYAGSTWQVRDATYANEPAIGAYVTFGENAYAVEYEQEKWAEPDTTVFDAVMSSISLAETDEPLAVNGDAVGSMRYELPEEEWREINSYERCDMQGKTNFKQIVYDFENYDALSFAVWITDDWKTFMDNSGIVLEDLEEVNIGGVTAYLKETDEETGSYYIGYTDGAYRISYYFDPLTEEREALLNKLLDSVRFE